MRYYSFVLLLLSFSTFSQTITLGSVDYPPYFGPRLHNYGVVSEIVQSAFKRQKVDSNVDFFPWARLMQIGKAGKVDALYTVWCTAERKRDFYYSHALFPNEVVLLKLKSLKIKFESYKDLRPYRIAYVYGYAYPDAFYQEPKLKLIKGYNDKENVEKLLAGKVDLVVIDKYQGISLLKELSPDKAKEYDTSLNPLSIMQQYVAVPKAIKHGHELIDKFNLGLSQMKEDGSFLELLKANDLDVEPKYWQAEQSCNP
ncbi:substrate-binding periplasmic protein [Vibrio marisflavi]|uniref:Solute-binding protein family 3/N-terminal domain-containing protein n=1 Tax=Vibrio marisflavi CECT 7928 TaxID=634439 RepID=A0ABN8E105_9VIBR|nr:transporter substrate-binding domain-containing protein [Vibrio marisflavi]CAH0536378.1 hypothetical protein VMF7928_00391 [Vibrio marisflavi CECT 7928]